MQYFLLASDYDGTIARHGEVSRQTIAALEQFLASGRKLLLITGRGLSDIMRVFPRMDLFSYIVAENGAIFYEPASGTKRLLGEVPPAQFVETLHQRGVAPLYVGEAIVATNASYAATVQEVIDELGLDWQIIFNKQDLMVLPTGVNKASGLNVVLRESRLTTQHVVGVGDAENDTSFLSISGYAVAVGNALPEVKALADFVTAGEDGEGVTELITWIIKNDL